MSCFGAIGVVRKVLTTIVSRQWRLTYFKWETHGGAYINMDNMRCVDFLSSLTFVADDRIGCLDYSMVGYRSCMLSSMTDKVKVSASVCWMNTTEYLMTLDNNQNKGGSAYSMLLPRIRKYMDYPHVACIACPKPSLFFNGRYDKLFPVAGVSDSYSLMREVWDNACASDRLVKCGTKSISSVKECRKKSLHSLISSSDYFRCPYPVQKFPFRLFRSPMLVYWSYKDIFIAF